VKRSHAYALLLAACVLPRLAVLLYERSLEPLEKSDVMARVFLDSGTFGYIPGEPSASTQPLYGWFLIGVYWVGNTSWWSLGTAQILVAAATSVVVYETGRRFLSPRVGLIGALIATVQPYLVWHDVHGNREILDQLLGAAMFGLTLLVAARPSLRLSAALGLVSGVAILSNTRLIVFPLGLAGYLLWRRAGWKAAVVVPVLAAIALVPWIVRNKIEVGCFTTTTDARALWKANNLGTFQTLRDGGWIDDVPDIPQRRGATIPDEWRTPQETGVIFAGTGRVVHVDECAQQRYYQDLVEDFWREHPGEKLKLAAQATWMMWDPRAEVGIGPGSGISNPRSWVQPLFVVPLYLLALWGLFVVPSWFRALALVFVGYETVMAWIFAGTTRYRVPWDFVLALLAAAVIARLPFGSAAARLGRSRPSSQNL
jgi:4-amino-4-deoxy-L-arabinose transferase-like glycosyltransferase